MGYRLLNLPVVLLAAVLLQGHAGAQTLPGSVSFSVAGSFGNEVEESQNSVLIADNNLTNGYKNGFDLQDAPSGLGTMGPAGSAAFQWGSPSTNSAYPHASALWFVPTAVANAGPNSAFKIADLYYRNGTIVTNTGASSVDLALTLTFSSPGGLSQVHSTYTMNLLNTANGSDPVASADIVELGNTHQSIQFTDGNGNTYYLNLNFMPDSDTLDGTLSTPEQFRVYEGTQGRAELWGQFSITPGLVTVPEPSSMLFGGLGSLLLFRRRR